MSREPIRNQIIKTIFNAQSSILAAVAWLTDPVLMDELAKKAKQGLFVEMLIDDDSTLTETINFSEWNLPNLHSLINAGVSIYVTPHHNKFCIIDFSTRIVGSYNWTITANKKSEGQESIEILQGQYPALIEKLDQYFLLKRKAIDLYSFKQVGQSAGRIYKVAGQSKDGKALKLQTGEVILTEDLAYAIKNMYVNVRSDTNFSLTTGVQFTQKPDGCWAFSLSNEKVIPEFTEWLNNANYLKN